MRLNKINVQKAIDPEDLQHVLNIRRKVFVEEQNCPPEVEWEFEDESQHFLAQIGQVPAGACRWRQTDNGIKLERFAVLKEFRESGVGKLMLRAVLEDLPAESAYVYLHAQLPVLGFYKKFGFEAEGEMFEEAGIQHYKMVLKNKSSFH